MNRWADRSADLNDGCQDSSRAAKQACQPAARAGKPDGGAAVKPVPVGGLSTEPDALMSASAEPGLTTPAAEAAEADGTTLAALEEGELATAAVC